MILKHLPTLCVTLNPSLATRLCSDPHQLPTLSQLTPKQRHGGVLRSNELSRSGTIQGNIGPLKASKSVKRFSIETHNFGDSSVESGNIRKI